MILAGGVVDIVLCLTAVTERRDWGGLRMPRGEARDWGDGTGGVCLRQIYPPGERNTREVYECCGRRRVCNEHKKNDKNKSSVFCNIYQAQRLVVNVEQVKVSQSD